MAKRTIKKIITVMTVALFWLLLWQIAALIVARQVLLPTPLSTLKILFHLMGEKAFVLTLLSSVRRIVTGFLSGVLAGTLIGALTYKIKLADCFLKPLDSIIKATPVASFIILALVWLKKDTIPSFTSFLIVTPVVWSGVKSALLSVDKDLLEAAEVFNLSFTKRVKYLYLPSIRIKYFSSLETSLGLAWKAGIAAEVLCTPKMSIGRELYNSKVYLETEKLFAWTFCVIVISLLLESAMRKLSEITLGKEV